MWTWGEAGLGQLWQNATVYRSSPVQVGALTTWAQVAAGDYHTTATKTDGTLWAWGRNNAGQLGIRHKFRKVLALSKSAL
jgi:alpha-tubulin suppressor-like RCC1 family protein